MSLPLLNIKNLSVAFRQGTRVTNAVRNASLELHKGETLALVGESGSGKSVTAHSILRLLPYSASHPNGEIIFDGENLLQLSDSKILDRWESDAFTNKKIAQQIFIDVKRKETDDGSLSEKNNLILDEL